MLANEGFDHFKRYLFAASHAARLGGSEPRMLDVGSGARSPLKAYCDAVLLDIALPTDVIADATLLPFRDRAFDAAFAIDLLEHLPGVR